MHAAVKAVIVLIVIVVTGITVIATAGFCPPAGPWPLPPRCPDKVQFSGDMSTVAGGIFMPGTGSTIQPAPAPLGTPLSVTFRAALPVTDIEVNINISCSEHVMNREAPYLFALAGIPVKSGDTLQYSYKAGDLETAPVEKTITHDGEIGDGLIWTRTYTLKKPGFVKGHSIMDAGSTIPAAAKSGYLWNTYEAMKADGGEYVAYDYYRAYTNTSVPTIVDEAGAGIWNAADEDTIGLMADEAHRRGLKFMLYTELEWTVIPGEFPSSDNDAYMKYQENKWTEGKKTVQVMADRLTKNPADPEANVYWDRWFAQFREFMLKSAAIAQEHDIEMLALGKQIDGAMIPANEQRWRALIAEVRKMYHGKLTQVLFTNELSDHAPQVPWADGLDVITIYYYNRFSDAERPDLLDLGAAMDSFNRKQFDPLFEKYHKPIIFLLPFQSRDYAAGQVWFEPMATSPPVRQDLLAQADLYEAFFMSTADEPWCGGAMTWGYWIEPGFDANYSFEKSSSVRGKPAALVVRKWFSQVKG